ncbi:MAG: hypothetical protein HN729_06815 [Candidatus Marinimicrobia bacterium]|jgi:tetrahydromethanopterin S-methyltransferase subunit B|nr:hypothetical protein [Candidatus Neomarinimicrobiota bacterium]MBT3633666.1 hypothetical protein [Candidatus Neomarinimicrobiota bacterium]MBT3682381.1 hypothetical protein [Candidatus Neomarinimicrobiota bacterium]MBT3759145.1 hypothetical protein [Candidatus Neomarinimicrobiota bacterium]MBT3895582.1 hypothetical protein [Candidatus Neomarinimicrobiota bacterium]
MDNIDKNIYILEKRIEDLERKLNESDEQYLHPGLNNTSFLRRAFTVFGHNLVAGLILSIPFYLIMFILVALLSKLPMPY